MTTGGSTGVPRDRYEAALAEIASLRREVITLNPEFGLVTESDLQDLKVSDDSKMEDWKAKAKEVQAQRAGEQRELLKRAGLDEKQIEAVMAGEQVVEATGDEGKGEESKTVEAGQQQRVVATARSAGSGVRPPGKPESGAQGYEAIREHFASQGDKK